MEVKAPVPDPCPKPKAGKTSVAISRWINERYPPLHDLLSAHDVARLTRRPRWVLAALCLIGRFPKKLKFRGRAIGWWRSDVLTWLARDFPVTSDHAVANRSGARRSPRQISLPLKRIGGVPVAHRNRARGTYRKASPRVRR